MTLSSLTAVVVVREACPGLQSMMALSDTLAGLAGDANIVIVANGVAEREALDLKALVAQVPDTAAIFLGDRQHDDVARLAGIDQAIGDFVLFCGPAASDLQAIPRLVARVGEGYDLVVGEAAGAPRVRRSALSRCLFKVFLLAFRHLNGLRFEPRPTGLRILSRSAALYLASRADGEVLIRAASIGSGFPAVRVPLPAEATGEERGIDTAAGIAKGLRLVLTMSAAPLRVASYAGLAGGAVSLLYSIYILAVFLTKPDVAPGWTTMSLQISAMMFIFSVMFVFLAEYQIQLLSSRPAQSRRHLVVREVSSLLSRRTERFNIVDAEGRFRVGAPNDLLCAPEKVPA